MPQLLEIKTRSLPENFAFPQEIGAVIATQLGPYQDKSVVLGRCRRKEEFIGDPLQEAVLSDYDAVLAARSQEIITAEEFSAHLDRVVEEAKSGKTKALALQLRFLGPLMDLARTIQVKEAIAGFSDGCGNFGIDLDKPDSIFVSDVIHPAAQALAIQLMGLTYEINGGQEEDKIDDLYRLGLALRWHFLPHYQPFGISAIAGSMNRLGLWAYKHEDLGTASTLFDAGADLLIALKDRTGQEMKENAGLILVAMGEYEKALKLLQAAKDSGIKLGVGERPLAVTRGNILVTQMAYLNKADVPITDWQSLLTELQDALDACRLFEQPFSIVELTLAISIVGPKVDKNFDPAPFITEATTAANELGVKAVCNYVHPGVRDKALEILED